MTVKEEDPYANVSDEDMEIASTGFNALKVKYEERKRLERAVCAAAMAERRTSHAINDLYKDPGAVILSMEWETRIQEARRAGVTAFEIYEKAVDAMMAFEAAQEAKPE